MRTDEQNYQARMRRKKAHIDARIEAANIDRGIIIALTGNGKGKSSSAFGMVCRALGHRMRVAVVKFLKGADASGEDFFLEKQDNIRVAKMRSGFTWETQNRELDRKEAERTWTQAAKFLGDKTIDLVVLDEISYMINYDYLDEKMIIHSLKNRPVKQHVVITGRSMPKNLIEISDTVSEVKDIKHAFRQNIRAQKGLDL